MKSLEIGYEETAGIDKNGLKESFDALKDYRELLRDVVKHGGYEAQEASLNLCDDDAMRKSVDAMVAEKKTDVLKYVFVIGIGGSNLGTYAIYDALRGPYASLRKDGLPKMVFIDTVSDALMASIEDIIGNGVESADEVCVNVISKSGTTAETIALFEIVYALLKRRFSDIDRRIVVTTDEGSKLHQAAQDKGFSVLFLPGKVGGRYSVFSAVGLFPLGLAGVDTAALIDGARSMRDLCLGDDAYVNPALVSAALMFAHYVQGIRIENSFFFNPELEMAGKWYRQLMGESVGKEYDIDGKVIHAGITPIVSIGSTDLHSMAQLYFGGPRDKFTCFVRAEGGQSLSVGTSERVFPALVESVSGKSLDDIMTAIYGGVKAAYAKNDLPYMEILLPAVDAATLGQYLQLRMVTMMYLARLMRVDAFDQPNVEDYKSETRKLL